MISRKVLFGFLLLFSGQIVAQNLLIEVSILGSATGAAGAKITGHTINATLKNSTGVVLSSGSFDGNTSSLSRTFTYSGASGIPFTGKISGGGSYSSTCKNPNDDTPVPGCSTSGSASVAEQTFTFDTTGGRCKSFSFSNPQAKYSFSVTVNVYTVPLYAPSAPEGALGCVSTVVLSISDSAPSFDWQVSENIIAGSWTTFRTNAAPTITATVSELTPGGFTTSKYSNRWVRAIGTDCGKKRISPQSNSFNFYAPAPVVTITSTNPRCYNTETGSITVKLTSSAPAIDDFQILLYGGEHPSIAQGVAQKFLVNASTYTFQDLKSGNYWISVVNDTDINSYGNCSINLHSLPALTLTDPPKLTASFTTSNYKTFGVSCNGGNDGSIRVTPSGGSGSYSYVWTNNVSSTNEAFGLYAGDYTVTVKDSNANKCFIDVSVTLSQPSQPPSVSIASAGGISPYDVSCAGVSDGVLVATGTSEVTGGTASYTWNTGSSQGTLTNLGSGTYSVTYTDGNGCTATSSKTMTVRPDVDFSIQQLHGIDCHNQPAGQLGLESSVTNGTSPLVYQWSSGESTTYIADKMPGTYSLTVTDAKGCRATKTRTLVNPPAYSVTINPQLAYHGAAISCNGEADGEITSVVRDGNNNITTASYYEWFKNGVSYNQGPSKTFIDQLEEGSYKLVVTYGANCSVSSQDVLLNDPEPVSAFINKLTDYNGFQVSCNGLHDGSIRGDATGGTGNYSFLWNTESTNSTLSNIGRGTYLVTVTDVNGCQGTAEVEVSEPASVTASITDYSNYSGFGVSCFDMSDGNIATLGAGGTGAYSYAWSNQQATAAIGNLSIGVYTATITDSNGCQTTIDHEITGPDLLEVVISSAHNISCNSGNDGEISVTPLGGAGAFEYSIDGEQWYSLARFENLTAGNYSVNVRDANGCNGSVDTALTEPPPISISFSDIVPAYCEDPRGSAHALVTGGVGNFQYTWLDRNGNIVGTEEVLSNVFANIYTLNIEDANHCPAQNSVPITSTDGAHLSHTTSPALCHDSRDGSASVTVLEGDGPFTVEWSNGQSALQAINLTRGQYYVVVTDAHDCAVVETVVINSPDPISMSAQQVMPTCNSLCDGQLILSARGGTFPYQFSWNNSLQAHQVNLCAGRYDVQITDSHGCILNDKTILGQPDVLQIQRVEEKKPTCFDGCDGAIKVAATGGNGDYSFLWGTGESTALKSDACPGTYGITVRDGKGCTATDDLVLENTPPVQINLGGGVTLCTGQTFVLNAGDKWTTVEWTLSAGTKNRQRSITADQPGTYHVKVTDEKGCVGEDSFLIETSGDLLKATFLLTSEAMVGDTVVVVDVSWPLPDQILWSYPAAMQVLSKQTDILAGKFSNPGQFEISLDATLGECHDRASKTVTILDHIQSAEGGRLGFEEFVKRFTLYPNPNDGTFDVAIELAQPSEITLSAWSVINPRMIMKVAGQNESTYLKAVDLRPLPAGTYILRLDHPRGKEYLRFLVR